MKNKAAWSAIENNFYCNTLQLEAHSARKVDASCTSVEGRNVVLIWNGLLSALDPKCAKIRFLMLALWAKFWIPQALKKMEDDFNFGVVLTMFHHSCAIPMEKSSFLWMNKKFLRSHFSIEGALKTLFSRIWCGRWAILVRNSLLSALVRQYTNFVD